MSKILIVGSGLYGATWANLLCEKGHDVTVIEKREHVGGNCYTYEDSGIQVHKYGPHYFHTNSYDIWKFVNKFNGFVPLPLKVLASYEGHLFSFPINLFTMFQVWGIVDPEIIKRKIAQEVMIFKGSDKFSDAESYIKNTVGSTLFNLFYKYYTIKQWGVEASKLPADIVKRIPIRFTFDDTYHKNTAYHGVPMDGYTRLISKMLEGSTLSLNTNFFTGLDKTWHNQYDFLVFSGSIDQFFYYKAGRLPYRTIRFDIQKMEKEVYQGCAQINHTDNYIKFTRAIEHKFLNPSQEQKNTIVSYEFPKDCEEGDIPMYPMPYEHEYKKYLIYREMSNELTNVHIGGRLGNYSYLDMDKVIGLAMSDFNKHFGN